MALLERPEVNILEIAGTRIVHEKTDYLCRAGPQGTGRLIELVIELFGGLEDRNPGFLAYVNLFVQDPGNGFQRNPGFARNIIAQLSCSMSTARPCRTTLS